MNIEIRIQNNIRPYPEYAIKIFRFWSFEGIMILVFCDTFVV